MPLELETFRSSPSKQIEACETDEEHMQERTKQRKGKINQVMEGHMNDTARPQHQNHMQKGIPLILFQLEVAHLLCHHV